MRIVRGSVIALLAAAAVSTSANAQLQYSVDLMSPFHRQAGFSGFRATLLYRNINSYSDPSIISLTAFTVGVSQRVKDFCNAYGLAVDSCVIAGDRSRGSADGTLGKVQTGTIPVGNSFWIYSPGTDEESCILNCSQRRFTMRSAFGVLGCQAPFPTPDTYSGRTCAADGYDGWLTLSLQFNYFDFSAFGDVPRFEFNASDLYMTAVNTVWAGPSGFVPISLTPEPSTWVLMGTGMLMVATMSRRRRKQTGKL
jgi:PEP-CTERM motif